MEDELLTSSAKSYSEQFYEHFPYYLSIGMPSDEYWNGEAILVKSYREADKVKQTRKNEELWLQGMYIHDAVGCVIHNALSKKGTTPKKYPKEPYRLQIKEDKKDKESRIETERKKAIAFFSNMERNFKRAQRKEAINNADDD